MQSLISKANNRAKPKGSLADKIAQANARTAANGSEKPAYMDGQDLPRERPDDIAGWAINEAQRQDVRPVEPPPKEDPGVASYVDMTMTGPEREQRRREEERISGAFKKSHEVLTAMREAGVEQSAIAKLEEALKAANRQTEVSMEIKSRSKLEKEFVSNSNTKRGGKVLKLERAVNGFGSIWRDRWLEVKLGWLWCYVTEKRPDKGEKPQVSVPLVNPTTTVERCSQKFAEHFGQKYCLNVRSPDWSGKELTVTLAFERKDFLLQWEHIIRSARQENHSMGPRPTLHKCAQRGELEQVKTLIKEGQDVNAGNVYDYTSLHYAVVGAAAAMKEVVDRKPVEERRFKPEHSFEIVARLMAAGADVSLETRAGETPLDLVDVKCRDLPATRRLLRKVLKSSKQQYEHSGTIYIVPLSLQKLLQVIREELPTVMNNRDPSYRPSKARTSVGTKLDDTVSGSSRDTTPEDAAAAAARRSINPQQYAHKKQPGSASSRSVSPQVTADDPLKKFYNDLYKLKTGRDSPSDERRSGTGGEGHRNYHLPEDLKHRTAPGTEAERVAEEIRQAKEEARSEFRSVSRSSRSSRSRSSRSSSHGSQKLAHDITDPTLAHTAKDLRYAHGTYKGAGTPGGDEGRWARPRGGRASPLSHSSPRSRSSPRGSRRSASPRSSRSGASSRGYARGQCRGRSPRAVPGRNKRTPRHSSSPRERGRSRSSRNSSSPRGSSGRGRSPSPRDRYRDKTQKGEHIRLFGRERQARKTASPYRGGTPGSVRSQGSSPRSVRSEITPRSARGMGRGRRRRRRRRGRGGGRTSKDDRGLRHWGDRGSVRDSDQRSSRSGERSSSRDLRYEDARVDENLGEQRRGFERGRHRGLRGGSGRRDRHGSSRPESASSRGSSRASSRASDDLGVLGSGHSGLNALTQHMNTQLGRAVDLGNQMFPPPKKDFKAEKKSMIDLINKANSRPSTDGGGKGSMAAMIAKANQRKLKSSSGAEEKIKKKRPVPNWKANQIINYYLKQGGTELHRSDEEVLYNTKTLDMDYYKAINSKGSYKNLTEMQDAFKILNNGSSSDVIQVGQLENVLGQWGEKLHRNEMKEFLAVADPRGIGSVRYSDFLQFVTKLRIKPLESNSRLYNGEDDIVGSMKEKRLHHEQVVRGYFCLSHRLPILMTD